MDQHTFFGVDITNVGRGYVLPGTSGAAMPFATATVTILRLDQIMAVMNLLPQATLQRAAFAAKMEMSAIVQDARQNYVPVDRGRLQKSGAVKGPMMLGNGKFRVEGSFGPVTNKYGSNYAVPVHEIPAPPESSVSGRSARHPRGQWKYLETPFLKRAPDIADAVGRKIMAGLGADLEAHKQFGSLMGQMREQAGKDVDEMLGPE